MSLLDECRAVTILTSPGPWIPVRDTGQEGSVEYTERVALLMSALSPETPVYMVASVPPGAEHESGVVVPALTGNGPRSGDNAAFIAFAKSAMPALLDLYATLAEVVRLGPPDGGLFRLLSGVEDALRTALEQAVPQRFPEET